MQTALSAAAGDVVGVEEGLVLFFLWTRMPTTAPMIMARRRRTESRRMKRGERERELSKPLNSLKRGTL